MAYTNVEKINGHFIRKLHDQKKSKTFGYLTLPVDYDGKDPSKVKQYNNLTEARLGLGFNAGEHAVAIQDVAFLTKPKKVNPQNQAGYKASAK